jgi:peptidyl-prolyl cis-trans isomerase D
VLNSIRKKANDSVFLKVVFGAIVVVFVFWGVAGMRSDPSQVVARVNERVISANQFRQAYDNLVRAYRDAYPSGVPAELLRSQVLDQLVTGELLDQEAERIGLSVEEQELRESITVIPAFQVDGRFDKDAYVRTLQANNLKPSDFEESQRQQLLRTKVQELIQVGVHVTDAELRERYEYENERVKLRYLRVRSSQFLDQVAPTEEEISKYLADNQEAFREPERARITFIDFPADHFAAQIQPTEEEIQAYYESHQDSYRHPEQVRARHILFKVPANVTDDERHAIRARAAEVLESAKAGEDFAELAKQHSGDVTAASGGDLGFFARGTMTPAFEEASFALEPGGVSDLVDTPFGIHIIKLEERREEGVDTLEESRGKIGEEVRKQRGRHAALGKSEEAHDRIQNGEDPQSVAASLGLILQKPSPFAVNEPVPGIGVQRPLYDAVLQTTAGELGDIVTLESGYLVFRVDERIASHIPQLADVREKVELAVRAAQASKAAKERAEQVLARLKEKKDVDAIAAAENLSVEETGPIGRVSPYVASLGNQPDLKEAAFRLTAEDPVAPGAYDVSGDAIVAVLAERTPADLTKFDAEKDALREQVRRRLESAAINQFIDQLRSKAQIEVGQAYGQPAGL